MAAVKKESSSNFSNKKYLLIGAAIALIAIILFFIFYSSPKEDTEIKKESSNSSTVYFDPSQGYVGTNEGYTLSVEGYKFEKVRDDYGTINEITVYIDNEQGSNTVKLPILQVFVSNAYVDIHKSPNMKSIEIEDPIPSGSSVRKVLKTSVPISDINEIKKIKVTFMEKNNRAFVSSEFYTNLSEGFKLAELPPQ